MVAINKSKSQVIQKVIRIFHRKVGAGTWKELIYTISLSIPNMMKLRHIRIWRQGLKLASILGIIILVT